MKLYKLFLAVMLLSVAGVGSAWADHRHGRSGVHFGVVIGPQWGPWYYPQPYNYPPYYPPVVVERYNPPVYIEQPAPIAPPPNTAVVPPPAPQTNYWYYCAASKAYYPYVRECPGGWQKVLPQPPGQP